MQIDSVVRESGNAVPTVKYVSGETSSLQQSAPLDISHQKNFFDTFSAKCNSCNNTVHNCSAMRTWAVN